MQILCTVITYVCVKVVFSCLYMNLRYVLWSHHYFVVFTSVSEKTHVYLGRVVKASNPALEATSLLMA